MIYVISFSPLANRALGREIAIRHRIPPYVDASCRREPDFEADPPFVSGLCRPRFIATLEIGDTLVFITNKRAIHRDGRRLVAVLRLKHQFESHSEAASDYLARGHRVPYSCVVPGNPPLPIDHCDPKMTRHTAAFKDSSVWDRAVYVSRAKSVKRCFAAEPLHLNLSEPPSIPEVFWERWLGHDPGTSMQNGGLAIKEADFEKMLDHTGIQLYRRQEAPPSLGRFPIKATSR